MDLERGVFHRLCNGRANTLTIVKSTTGYIFGGYTSIAWSSVGEFRSDSTAFLFTLTNPTNKPMKLNIKTGQEQKAVWHRSRDGPVFGDGYDLFVYDESNTNLNNWVYSLSYDAPNGQTGEAGGKFIHGGSTNYFQTVEVEVFQVGPMSS